MTCRVLNLLLLANILLPLPHRKLSADVEDRRTETHLHKYVTVQVGAFRDEWRVYVIGKEPQ